MVGTIIIRDLKKKIVQTKKKCLKEKFKMRIITIIAAVNIQFSNISVNTRYIINKKNAITIDT